MDALIQQLLGVLEQLACEDDGSGSAVTALGILRLGNLDNHLGGRVLDLDFL